MMTSKENWSGVAVRTLLLGLSMGVAVAAADTAPTKFSASNMQDFETEIDVTGASLLTRQLRSVHIDISTSGLVGGNAFTVWWVIFNRPNRCAEDECGLGDLSPDSPAKVSVVYATGGLSDMDGDANFRATLHQRTPAPPAVAPLFGPGLSNVAGAAIHVILKDHGPAVPGMVAEQISTVSGDPDVQFSVHNP